ncbi:histone-lysine N-methyltransferase [Rhynchospora pubera]|uniref:Histone-lysine N-methyltransferase n=1 Tax=Rhynchospora pubera TaxID=906938 RepID=A0AAV8FFI0_9POAL|nr:histone-lysine N-methyltransferase [Rhynchospora pubera]
MDNQVEQPPPYIHIDRNEFSYRKHKKQKEEDINICVCKYNPDNPDSACGDQCLNLLTSTECTPGYCPCGDYCKNQRFQKCQYAKTRLFKTEGRGWGLLADENIKAGQFVIEYCGEVISWREAKRRSHAYESEGIKDAYIIYLNANESIDATRKGSLARFINHSCQPNCETRKWNVLGEIRVGIFAKQDIPIGAELSYNYNFEWYGGIIVKCLCGAITCSGFLGAKSRGFQEATYLWEDDDDRFSVENVPLYDSDDDEPMSLSEVMGLPSESDTVAGSSNWTSPISETEVLESVEPLDSIPMESEFINNGKRDNGTCSGPYASQKNLSQSTMRTNVRGRKPKTQARTQLNASLIAERLASKEAQEEILACEETSKEAASRLNSVYNEIRPAIEEHERDNQDSVSTSLAEKWIQASCLKYKADFDLYSTIIRNVALAPKQARQKQEETASLENGLKYLEN